MLNIQRLQSRLEKPLKSRSLARSDSFAFLQNFTWVGPSIIWPPSRDPRTSRADCQIECGALSKPLMFQLGNPEGHSSGNLGAGAGRALDDASVLSRHI